MSLRDADPTYFYELHEGDDELFLDVILAHDAEYDEAEFLELVLEARAKVLDTHESDTLVEAVAAELATTHGFLVIDDSQLRVAVNVSVREDETVVAEVDASRAPRSAADEVPEEGFRSLLVDIEPDDASWERD